MRQKVFLIGGILLLVIVLIGLNVVSYRQKETEPDTEFKPDRSTYNLGSTGTRAFFDFLNESGRKAVRWQLAPAELTRKPERKPGVFVISGPTRKEISDVDATAILEFAAQGGTLVLIDRDPPRKLLPALDNWRISVTPAKSQPAPTTDATDVNQMTAGTDAAKPVQPTLLTIGINSVQTSAFAGSVAIVPHGSHLMSVSADNYEGDQSPSRVDNAIGPVVHVRSGDRNVVVDVPFGSGRIVLLTDPYVIANSGVSLADNLMVATNIVGSAGGTIAFDEYHNGYGLSENRLLEFFAGTPVIPIIVQLAVIVFLIFFSKSRRFARPVPEPEPNRLSKLEYVAAMAELQQRTKGYDLAFENIYGDFRRRVARLVGVDPLEAKPRNLAILIAERLPDERSEKLEEILARSEDVMHGAPSGKRETLRLITRLREIEAGLGLQRRKKRTR